MNNRNYWRRLLMSRHPPVAWHDSNTVVRHDSDTQEDAIARHYRMQEFVMTEGARYDGEAGNMTERQAIRRYLTVHVDIMKQLLSRGTGGFPDVRSDCADLGVFEKKNLLAMLIEGDFCLQVCRSS